MENMNESTKDNRFFLEIITRIATTTEFSDRVEALVFYRQNIEDIKKALDGGLEPESEVMAHFFLGGQLLDLSNASIDLDETDPFPDGVEKFPIIKESIQEYIIAAELDKKYSQRFLSKTVNILGLHRIGGMIVLHSKYVDKSRGEEAAFEYLKNFVSQFDYLQKTVFPVLCNLIGLYAIDLEKYDEAKIWFQRCLAFELPPSDNEYYSTYTNAMRLAKENLGLLRSFSTQKSTNMPWKIIVPILITFFVFACCCVAVFALSFYYSS